MRLKKQFCFCNQSINQNPYIVTPYPINMNYKEDEYGFHCGNPVCNQRRCFACQNRLTVIYGEWIKVPERIE